MNTTIEGFGSTSLVEGGNSYILYPDGGSAVELSYAGAPVVAGQFDQFGGPWAPIGAEQTATGYEVAWKVTGADKYTVWYTDNSGKYVSSAFDVASGTSAALQSFETSFQQDLNGDGSIGLPPPPSQTVIEGFGSTSLVEGGSNYFLYPNGGGSAVELSYAGAPVAAGQFDQFGGPWAPIGAEQTATGYEVAWKITGADQYTVWTTDNGGNYVSSAFDVASGTSAALQSFETSFHQDLNGDGVIGPATVIEGFGSTSLVEGGSNYFLHPNGGSAVELSYAGAPVAAGQFDQFGGPWAPIGAEQTATGYEVAWKITGADQYTVWTTDNSGNYVSSAFDVASGTSAALQSFETSFHQDLNGDGVIGPANAVSSPHFVYQGVDGNGVQLYSVTWDTLGSHPFAVRVLAPDHPSTDYEHNFLFALPVEAGLAQSTYGSGLDELRLLDVQDQYNATIIEPIFPIDSWYANSNTDATINFETFTATLLTEWVDSTFATSGTEKNLLIGFSKSGYGALDLVFKHPSVFDAVAAWDFPADMAAYDAFGSSSSVDYGTNTNFQNNYQVTGSFIDSWKAPFTTEDRILISEGSVFQTDVANFDAMLTSHGVEHTLLTQTSDAHSWPGGWISDAVAGLYGLEPDLHQTVIEGFGSTSLVEGGNNYFLYPDGGSAVELSYAGTPVEAGQFDPYGPWTLVGAEQTANGYVVAWKVVGADQFQVWNADPSGNFVSSSGVVSGTSAVLESFEPSFQQDLNGDGSIGLKINVIESTGSTRLGQIENNYFLDPNGGSAVELSFGGAPVEAGQFDSLGGPWALVGAEQTASGYVVAWKVIGADQFEVWNADPSGNFVSSSGVVSGTSAVLESFEPSFQQDLNGDGSIGLKINVLESIGSTTLEQHGSNYFLYPNGGSAVELSYAGTPVEAGQFDPYGRWTLVGAEQTANGYVVAWKVVGADQFQVWNTDPSGNFVSSSGVVSGTSAVLESFEPSFQQDLNGDGSIGLKLSVIEGIGSTRLGQIENNYFLDPNGGPAVELSFGGAPVEAGQFDSLGGPWALVGAEQTASGYVVAWKVIGADQFEVWNADPSGNFVSSSGVVSGTSAVLESFEPSFQQDLNGDGSIGLKINVLESIGSTTLEQHGSNYFLYPDGGSAVELSYAGAPVEAGQFDPDGGPWALVGAEQTANGYVVAWKVIGADQLEVWNTDPSGNFVSSSGVVSGTSAVLESFEPSFQQDLNGDGSIGLKLSVIESIGSTRLGQIENNYFLDPNGGPAVELSFGGAPVEAGQFDSLGGPWALVGAEQTASGYVVAWKVIGADQFEVWNADPSGNFVSSSGVVSGPSAVLESFEPSFQQDLNGDGSIGLKINVLESIGSTALEQHGSNYFLYPDGGSAVELSYAGAPVEAGQFDPDGGPWALVGAEQTANGYVVAWKVIGADQLEVWNTDPSGNFVSSSGVVSGTSAVLESFEPSFQQDLNGDGSIGLPTKVIETLGSTRLEQVESNYSLDPNGGSAVELSFGGAPVEAGQFDSNGGPWVPIGAEQTASGYEVAWKIAGADQYTVWFTDQSGNYISSAFDLASGSSTALQSFETSFQQDLNGDGVIGALGAPPPTVIESLGSTSLDADGNNYFLHPSGGSPVELSFGGAPVAAGQFDQFGGPWAPIGAEQTATGYEVAWKITGADQYTVWTTDNSGNYVSSSFDVASGTSAALQSFETSFHQDLNGDGYIGLVLDGSSGGQTLTAGSSPTTLIGGPNDILNGGAGADTFVFPPNFGANEVNNFRPGTDQLEFRHSTFATVAEVLNNAHQSGSDVVIAHDPQDVVTLNNILLANLHASDFQLI